MSFRILLIIVLNTCVDNLTFMTTVQCEMTEDECVDMQHVKRLCKQMFMCKQIMNIFSVLRYFPFSLHLRLIALKFPSVWGLDMFIIFI